MRAFQGDNKDEVLLLLPRVHQPHLVRDAGSIPSGYTLLHHAAKCGWPDVCHTLVEHYQCKADDTNDLGWSVLDLACGLSHVSVVKYLLTLETVTVSDRDHLRRTSMELVTRNKYEIYSLFSSHVDLKMKLRVEAYFKVFICGN